MAGPMDHHPGLQVYSLNSDALIARTDPAWPHVSVSSLFRFSRLACPLAGSRSAGLLFSGKCYVRLWNCTALGLEVLIRLDEPTLALAFRLL